MADVLERICSDTRDEIARRKATHAFASVLADARTAPAPRGFVRALADAAQAGRTGLICEIKKASPSKALIRADFDPATLARAYQSGGATCLSVLTDGPWFQGADTHLIEARAAVDLPVLRKDFTLDLYQVAEARALGADCILLILAALSDDLAAELAAFAGELGLDCLCEVHDEVELARALALPCALIGINNRNLKTLEIDLATTERLAPSVPHDRLVVAESGLATSDDLARMARVGVTSFLIGESLMRSSDVAAATRRLRIPNDCASPAP